MNNPKAGPGAQGGERPFIIETAQNAQDCRRASDLLNLVWQMPADQDVLELSTLVAYVHSGCYVAAALEASTRQVIGASVAFFGPPGTSLHSHITGVHPSWAGQGVGRAMKEHQRAWCLERGVATITWTFDPLVARNAFFNLRTLGARATVFLPDHYGPMNDGRNAGHGSDRLMATWDLTGTTPRADQQRTAPKDSAPGSGDPRRHVALADHDGHPGEPELDVPDGCEDVEVAIPLDIEALRQDDPATAAAWRERTHQTFVSLLAAGWEVERVDPPARYVLTHSAVPRKKDA